MKLMFGPAIVVGKPENEKKPFLMPRRLAERGAELRELNFKEGDFAAALILAGDTVTHYAVIDLGHAFTVSAEIELTRTERSGEA